MDKKRNITSENIGANIRRLRTAHGETQLQLAGFLGYGVSTGQVRDGACNRCCNQQDCAKQQSKDFLCVFHFIFPFLCNFFILSIFARRSVLFPFGRIAFFLVVLPISDEYIRQENHKN